MDPTDYKILHILQKKARIPNIDVSRQIGMAPSAVLERIKKLETRGIIEGYEVRLNPYHFSQSMVAFLHITIENTSGITETCKKLSRVNQVQEVHYLAGEDCILVKLRAADPRALEKILTESVNSIDGVLKVRTHIALSTYKESAKIVIPDKPEKGGA